MHVAVALESLSPSLGGSMLCYMFCMSGAAYTVFCKANQLDSQGIKDEGSGVK